MSTTATPETIDRDTEAGPPMIHLARYDREGELHILCGANSPRGVELVRGGTPVDCVVCYQISEAEGRLPQ